MTPATSSAPPSDPSPARWIYLFYSASVWWSTNYGVYWVAAPSVEELADGSPTRLEGQYVVPYDVGTGLAAVRNTFGHGRPILAPDGVTWLFSFHHLAPKGGAQAPRRAYVARSPPFAPAHKHPLLPFQDKARNAPLAHPSVSEDPNSDDDLAARLLSRSTSPPFSPFSFSRRLCDPSLRPLPSSQAPITFVDLNDGRGDFWILPILPPVNDAQNRRTSQERAVVPGVNTKKMPLGANAQRAGRRRAAVSGLGAEDGAFGTAGQSDSSGEAQVNASGVEELVIKRPGSSDLAVEADSAWAAAYRAPDRAQVSSAEVAAADPACKGGSFSTDAGEPLGHTWSVHSLDVISPGATPAAAAIVPMQSAGRAAAEISGLSSGRYVVSIARGVGETAEEVRRKASHCEATRRSPPESSAWRAIY